METKRAHQKQIIELQGAVEIANADRLTSASFKVMSLSSYSSNAFNQNTRSEKLDTLNRLKKELVDLETELEAYGDSNPAKIEEAKRAVFLAKEAAYRWTGTKSNLTNVDMAKPRLDNYGVLLGHFTRQNCVSVQDVRQYLGVGEDYEDLE